MVEPIYKDLIETVGNENLVLMGDSAGGGLSLGLAEKMNNEGVSQPSQIILISPWLDVSMSNPEIIKTDKNDPFLGIEGLATAGKSYAGSSDLSNYLVSPINGNIDGLAKITIFTGTYDILYPDAKKFNKLAKEKGITINYIEYPKMIHVWVIMNMPEATKATEQIIELLKH